MQRYTKTAIALHWLIALLIIAAFLLGVTMVDIPGFTPTKLKYFSWHKWLGVTVLGLAAIRLLWRLRNKPPASHGNVPAWQIYVLASLVAATLVLGLSAIYIYSIDQTVVEQIFWNKFFAIALVVLAIPILKFPSLQLLAAEVMHSFLYVLMFAVPISGYLYSYAAGVPVVYLGLFQMPAVIGPDPALKPVLKTVHYVLTMTMAGAVLAHALAAIKHHLIDRDDTLKRMLP